MRDIASKNAFTKFETAISKKFEKQLEDFNEEEYRNLEHLQELFEFLDDIIPPEWAIRREASGADMNVFLDASSDIWALGLMVGDYMLCDVHI